MDRRIFLGLSATTSSLISSAASNARDAKPRIARQSEDGVFVERTLDSQMLNVAPTTDPVRSVDLHARDDNRRRWALQHVTELCRTQAISRGSCNVSVLPRKMQNIGGIRVRTSEGHSNLLQFLRDTSTDAFLVLQRGKIITEQYFNGMQPHTSHLVWSCSKSISAGVVANLLEADPKFRRDRVVTTYIPELKGCGYDGCTINDLLNMRSSIRYRFGLDPVNVLRHTSKNECGRHYRSAEMYPKIEGDDDTGQCAFLQSLVVDDHLNPHGSKFCYKDSDSAVLSWVCERVAGKRFVELISEIVWSQLGAEHDASIICGPQGACTSAAGVSLTLRDFARWGQMHLQSGSWQGKQVVPEKFVENVREYRTPLVFGATSYPTEAMLPNGTTYRDQFWITAENGGAFYALGHCGQICYVHPRSETVIVRFASAQELDPKYAEVFRGLADLALALS